MSYSGLDCCTVTQATGQAIVYITRMIAQEVGPGQALATSTRKPPAQRGRTGAPDRPMMGPVVVDQVSRLGHCFLSSAVDAGLCTDSKYRQTVQTTGLTSRMHVDSTQAPL